MPHAANYTAKAADDLQAEIDYYTGLHEAQYGRTGSRPAGDKAEWAHDYLLAEYKVRNPCNFGNFEVPNATDLLILHSSMRFSWAYQNVSKVADTQCRGEQACLQPKLEGSVSARVVLQLQPAQEADICLGKVGRLKREAKGEPAQKQKDPEQVAILENFLEEIQPYPSRVDIQDLVIATGGLTRKQITAWFEHQREKRGITEYADDYDARDESNNSRDPVWANHPGCTWKVRLYRACSLGRG